MKAAIYLRVSTDEQNTEMQRQDAIRYCKAMGLQYDIFEDKLSGKDTNRPEFQKMMEGVDGGYYGSVVVWKLDRFSRKLVDVVNLLDRMDAAGVRLISISEHLDYSTPIGRLLIQILGGFAEFEREQLRARVKRGLEAKRDRGERLGPKPKPIKSEILNELKKKGYTAQEIGVRFGLSRSQVYRRLSKVS